MIKYYLYMLNNTVITVFLILIAFPLQAKEYSWESLLSETKQHNPAIQQANESLEQARLSYSRAFSGYLPTVTASAQASQSGSETTSISKDYSYGLGASLSLFSGFSDFYSVKAKRVELDKALAQQQRSIADAVYNLRRAYLHLVWIQETVRISEDILQRREENLKLVRLKYEAGREDKGSMLRVEADKLQAAYDLASAKRALKTASFSLCEAIGLETFKVITMQETLKDLIDKNQQLISPDTDVESLIPAIPEYKIAHNELQRVEYDMSSVNSNLYPSLSLSAQSRNSGAQWDDSTNSWSVGVGVSYPLFSGGKNGIDRKIYQKNLRIAKEGFQKTKYALLSQLQTALNDYVDAVEGIEVRKKYMEASKEQSLVTTAKYINGLTTYYDWYSVESNYIGAQKTLINAQRDILLSASFWHKVLGKE